MIAMMDKTDMIRLDHVQSYLCKLPDGQDDAREGEFNMTPMTMGMIKGRYMSRYMCIVTCGIAARMTRRNGGFLSYL